MTTAKQARKYPPTGKSWRRRVSNVLVLVGAILLFGAALLAAKTALASQASAGKTYLVSSVDLSVPLPTLEPLPVGLAPAPVGGAQPLSGEEPPPVSAEGLPPTPVVETSPTPSMEIPQATLQDITIFLPLVSNAEPSQPGAVVDLPQPPLAPQYPAQSAGPVIRLEVPRLNIDRAVVTIDLHKSGQGQLEWNTDSLFATANRPDLVGQLATSVNPGDGGNIILVGHNYNNGWNWAGVFVNLDNLQPGDKVVLHTENGGAFEYQVQKVKKVPWQQQSAAELEKHEKYMWPTEREQLTLVTCGGSYLTSWSARIYVVAVPMGLAQ